MITRIFLPSLTSNNSKSKEISTQISSQFLSIASNPKRILSKRIWGQRSRIDTTINHTMRFMSSLKNITMRMILMKSEDLKRWKHSFHSTTSNNQVKSRIEPLHTTRFHTGRRILSTQLATKSLKTLFLVKIQATITTLPSRSRAIPQASTLTQNSIHLTTSTYNHQGWDQMNNSHHIWWIIQACQMQMEEEMALMICTKTELTSQICQISAEFPSQTAWAISLSSIKPEVWVIFPRCSKQEAWVIFHRLINFRAFNSWANLVVAWIIRWGICTSSRIRSLI